MNYKYIISKDGYRFEDLTKEHQEIIKWLRWLVEDFKNTDVECVNGDCFVDESIIGKAVREVQEKFKQDVEEWLDSQVDEFQIALAENESMDGSEDTEAKGE